MATIKKTRIVSSHNLYRHVTLNALMGLALIAAGLLVGILGYHAFQPMPWIDAFLNASMILSGMGSTTTMTTWSGKLFAGCYALFSGLAFIAIVVMMLSPVIHHFLRKIHLESKEDE